MLTFGADRCTALFDATGARKNTTTSVKKGTLVMERTWFEAGEMQNLNLSLMHMI
jgi:hypothetical protein